MKEKINYANCMKYKCELCRYNKQCEREEKKYEVDKTDSRRIKRSWSRFYM